MVEKKITKEALDRVEFNLNSTINALTELSRNENNRIFAKFDNLETDFTKFSTELERHIASDTEMKNLLNSENNNNKEILKMVIEQAERARIDSKELLNSFMRSQSSQFKILISILAGIATLITAFSKFFS
jgi:hypothetical protein